MASRKLEFFLVKIFLSSLHILFFTLPSYSSDDFGGRWSETLNFGYHNIKTGPAGNVWNLNDEGQFDLEKIHMTLAQLTEEAAKTTGESHNVVIAGLSIIFKIGENYEAIYSPFEETGSKILAFISGSVEKKGRKSKKFAFLGPSDTERPNDLLDRFQKRLKPVNGTVEEEEEEEEEDNCGPYGDLSHDKITQFYEKWKNDKENIFKEVKNGFLNILETAPDTTLLETLQERLDKSMKDRNSTYGSSIDSEQFLLRYLESEKRVLTEDQYNSNICIKYLSLVGKYKSAKLESLKSSFSIESLDESKWLLNKLEKNLEEIKALSEVGCILHLHSTNEVCCCCAYSITQELRHGTNLQKINEIMAMHNDPQSTYKPFFAICTSSSYYITPSPGGRPGIGKQACLNADDYDNNAKLVRLESLITKGVFLQKFLGESPEQPLEVASQNSDEKYNAVLALFRRNLDTTYHPKALKIAVQQKFSVEIELDELNKILTELCNQQNIILIKTNHYQAKNTSIS